MPELDETTGTSSRNITEMDSSLEEGEIHGVSSDNSSTKPEFAIGSTVRCTTASGDIVQGDTGTVVKVSKRLLTFRQT